MAAQKQRIDSKSEAELLLLVEGVNDCHAVHQLIELIYSAAPIFGVHECGGDEFVLDSMSSRLVDPRPRQRILGVVLDADIEGLSEDAVIDARLNQLKRRLGDYYELPDEFPDCGLILEPLANRPDASRLPRLGAWLMPDNRVFGMFEDLLSRSLSDTVLTYTDNVVSKAKTDRIAVYREAHKSKAIIRTYMAWQDPPDSQYIGLAIKNRFFGDLEAQCQSFVQWLETLFGAVALAVPPDPNAGNILPEVPQSL
jgi:hypothetical protein